MGLIEVHIWICPPQASTSTLYTTEWPGGCFTVYRNPNPLGIKAIMTPRAQKNTLRAAPTAVRAVRGERGDVSVHTSSDGSLSRELALALAFRVRKVSLALALAFCRKVSFPAWR